MALLIGACEPLSGLLKPPAPPDAGIVNEFYFDTGAEEKALLYNLIGRWYPEDEIRRLSDRTLTAEQWCEREPSVLFIVPERLEVRCKKGGTQTAAIAKVDRDKDGSIVITTRVKEGEKLRQIRIDAKGPKARISGSPCFSGANSYGRFPEYEVLSREILGDRRCPQLAEAPKEEMR